MAAHNIDFDPEVAFEEFKRWLHTIMPRDRTTFIDKFLENLEEAKKVNMPEEVINNANYNKEENIYDKIINEIKETRNELETTQFIEQAQQAINELKNGDNEHTIEQAQQVVNEHNESEIRITAEEALEQEKEFKNDISNGMSDDELFENRMQDKTRSFVNENLDELITIGIAKSVDDYHLLNESMLFSDEQIEQFRKEFDLSENKQEWTPDITMDSVKKNQQDSLDFVNGFIEETKEISNLKEIKSLSDLKKGNLNPDSYFTDLVDWFEKKKVENLNMPMSKDEFKKEFYEYCKSGMSENEMKILLILSQKEPTTLTKEHKDMIKEGLKLNTINSNLLDKGLDTAIRAQIGENVTNANVIEFSESIDKLQNSKNLIDKKLLQKGTLDKLSKTIMEKAPKLTDETKQKLESTLENIEKGKELSITQENTKEQAKTNTHQHKPKPKGRGR